MSWTQPHVFVVAEIATAAQLNTYVKDNLIDLDRRATVVASNMLGAGETTTSTSYTNLTTVGPAVSVSTGTLCLIGMSMTAAHNTANGSAIASYAVSGATTIAAADDNGELELQSPVGGHFQGWGVQVVCSGLTPGTNVFTMKYKIRLAGTGSFFYRHIWALPVNAA